MVFIGGKGEERRAVTDVHGSGIMTSGDVLRHCPEEAYKPLLSTNRVKRVRKPSKGLSTYKQK